MGVVVSLFRIVDLLLQVLSWIVFVQVLLSWLVILKVINTHNDFVRQLLYALDRITRPLYRPVRRLLPDFGGIDFSPIVLLLLIYMLRILLQGLEGDILGAYPG